MSTSQPLTKRPLTSRPLASRPLSGKPAPANRSSKDPTKGTDMSPAAAATAARTPLKANECYWIPHPSKVFAMVMVKRIDKEKCLVTTVDDNKDLELDVHYPFFPVNPATVADMATLPHIHEAGVLSNLKERAKVQLNCPYTYIAHVLVAVNPLRDIAEPRVEDYRDQPITANEPHPFGVAELAYSQMTLPKIDDRNQYIVITGESGAGKSETSKIVTRYLICRRSGGDGAMARASSRRGPATIDQRVVEAGVVLEAFGNAKTARNNNSSRFGRVTKLYFDEQSQYGLSSAAIETYLLEKSRVVSLAEGERNFHVFYQLLAAGDKKKWRLKGFDKYNYITQSSEVEIENVNDEHSFYALCSAMTSVGILLPDQDTIFRVLSAVLALGNIEFRGDDSSEEDITVVEESYTVTIAAELLGVSREALEHILLTKTVTADEAGDVAEESMVSHSTVRLTSIQATSARDSVAKSLYKGLFDWVVRRIDDSLSGETSSSNCPYIGVVDMFGFESVELNRLGQLLINFTDESLQMSFNKAVISGEQAIYREEGFDLGDIAAVSNALSFNLIGKGPSSIISVLNDVCKGDHPSEEKFNSTLHHEHRQNADFPHPSSRDARYAFIVRHYSHPVQYTVGNFIPHNLDAAIYELKDLLASSVYAGPGSLFNALYQAGGGASVAGGKAAGGATLLRSMGMVKTKLLSRRKVPADGTGARPTKEKDTVLTTASTETIKNPLTKPVSASAGTATLAASYTKQISRLCNTLESTTCSFIRCVKPNATMSAGVFEPRYVVEQLRSLVVMQTCEVLRLGLPTHVNCELIEGMYRPHLRPVAGLNSKQFVRAILCSCEPPIPRQAYEIGNTRLFFKTGCLSHLKQLTSMDITDAKTRNDLSARVFKYLVNMRWNKIRAIVIVQKMFVYARRRSRATLFLQDRWRYFTISPKYQRKRLNRRRWRIAICRVLFENKFLRDYELIVESKELRLKNENEASEEIRALEEAEDKRAAFQQQQKDASVPADADAQKEHDDAKNKSDMQALIYASNISTLTVCLNRWMKINLYRTFETWKEILHEEGFNKKRASSADGTDGEHDTLAEPLSMKIMPFNLDAAEEDMSARVSTDADGNAVLVFDAASAIECFECSSTSQVNWCGSCQQMYCSLCSQLVHGSCRLMRSHKPVVVNTAKGAVAPVTVSSKPRERCSIKSCTNEATKGVSTRFCEMHYEEFRQQTKSSEEQKTLQQQIMILERQLKVAGLQAVQYVDLGEAKNRMNDAVAVLISDSGSDREKEKAEKEIEEMERVMNLNPEYIAEKEQKARQWEEGEKVKNLACVHRMRELVPPDVNSTSQQKMNDEGLPKSIVSRIWSKKALRLICTHPNDIRRLHIAELTDKYTTQGLDIVELRAVFQSLPQDFDLDSDGKKAQWRNNIREKLLELSNKETGGRLSNVEKRNVAYKGHDHFKLYDPAIVIEPTKRQTRSDPFHTEKATDVITEHRNMRKELLKPVCEGMSRVGVNGKRLFLSLQPTKARGRVLLGFANEADAKAELAARNASDSGVAPDGSPKPIMELKLEKTFEVKAEDHGPKFMIVNGDSTVEVLDGERAKWTPALLSAIEALKMERRVSIVTKSPAEAPRANPMLAAIQGRGGGRGTNPMLAAIAGRGHGGAGRGEGGGENPLMAAISGRGRGGRGDDGGRGGNPLMAAIAGRSRGGRGGGGEASGGNPLMAAIAARRAKEDDV